MSSIDSVVDNHMDDVIMDLQTLIRQPSVSAKQEGLFDCAELVSHIIQRAGIKTELLHLTDLKAMDVPVHIAPPIVYGEVKSKCKDHIIL